MTTNMITADQLIELALRGFAAYIEIESQTRANVKFRIRLDGEAGTTCIKVHKSHPSIPFLEVLAA